MGIISPHMDIDLFIYVACIWHLKGIFVSWIHIRVVCEVNFALWCLFTHVNQCLAIYKQVCVHFLDI